MEKYFNIDKKTECIDRLEEIDIIKGFGIILMVAGHSGAPITKFIYLFHMAIFFIASGFVNDNKSSDNKRGVLNVVIRRIKSLWLPYFIWNTIFTLMNNFFLDINVYTNNLDISNYVSESYVKIHRYLDINDMIKEIVKGVLFCGGTEIGGACWFLRILFMISVSYCIIDYISKRIFKKYYLVCQFIVSTILLSFGYQSSSLQISVSSSIARMSSFYCLYFIGVVLGKNKESFTNIKWKTHVHVVVFSFLTLNVLNNFGNIDLVQNEYTNPIFLLVSSICGWLFLYSTAYFVKQTVFKNITIEIGRRTLPVLILHFLTFKIIAAIIVRSYELPDFCIAAFPNLYGYRGLWWMAYTIVGVGVPVLLSRQMIKLK